MMKEFAVIGLGNFGSTVARELAELKCKVTAIDRDKSRVQPVQDDVDVAIVADATDREFLAQLNVRRFNSVIVSTGEDAHAAILITLHLKGLEAQQIIAKANSEDHAKILIAVGATDAVIPEKQMATRLAHFLAQSNLIDYLPLAEDYCVAELDPPARLVNKTLEEAKLRSKYDVQVIAVKDGPSGEFKMVPGGDYRIKGSDVLVVLGKARDVDKLRE